MNDHQVDGTTEAQQNVDASLPPSTGATEVSNGAISVHHLTQVAHDASHRAHQPRITCHHELHFDVTKNASSPPRSHVVGGPDESIDESKEVVDHDPEDQA